MHRIYFDNAATTALAPEVLEAMMPFLTEKFGNPSSIYSYGRESKMAIEAARKTVARILNCNPGEIFFTSGGTESSNTAINASVNDLGCKHIITSPIEHHATLHTVENLEKKGIVRLSIVKLTDKGHIDMADLESLLANSPEKTLVTLMHANNEVGNILDIQAVGELCKKYDAIFHSDTVQTVGHYPFDLKNTYVHFINGAGHKFHGPKGVGILYVNENIQIKPLINGGSQERNMRAGTENLYGIVGFAKALEMATEHYNNDSEYIRGLKSYMAEQLTHTFAGVSCNGDTNGRSLYTVLNVSFPKTDKTDMLLFNLDMAGICVSGGSACSSGASSVSHVIKALYNGKSETMVPIRFSFSKQNTKEEVDAVIEKLKDLI
ncbi:cysteine desulfurase family protein [Taibaiella soli]|uniref:cysteine desulfurase n=1 Tax=Taibaiella soli TaxID=1649169 RepID=A0A2W2AN38_9BACT|nr:cysteine desulfurase family protein [Taibaiella soli]PZF73740.1 cysteine desulfurase [Taibaiella soli]